MNYHNSAGYSEEQIADFYRFVDSLFGHSMPAPPNALRSALNFYQRGYGRPFAIRNYLYAQASQKEPFNILYFTPSLTTMINLDDHSFQVNPKLLYTGKNLELRLRLFALFGGAGTELGQKPNSQRLTV